MKPLKLLPKRTLKSMITQMNTGMRVVTKAKKRKKTKETMGKRLSIQRLLIHSLRKGGRHPRQRTDTSCMENS